MTHSSFRLALALIATHSPLMADIIVPGANGTDEALNITADTVIDLSQAPTGTWDQNNAAQAGKGVYDPEKWAVVFKYSSVNIATGAKVTFKNHATRAPVVWLVNGDVTIAGTVDLSGESAYNVNNSPLDGWAYTPQQRPLGGRLTEPGPGGFRGGAGWRGGNVLSGAGFGPGGGNTGKTSSQNKGDAAGFGLPSSRWVAGSGGQSYGNPSLIPLIGGSGGAGNQDDGWGRAGGAGGGAILIACANKIEFSSGLIKADGGSSDWDRNGAGSGGGIRLVSKSLEGTGALSAVGGVNSVSAAGSGRIRLERTTTSGQINVSPSPSTLDLAGEATAQLWPPSGSPEARVLSINSVNAPPDPTASFGAYSPDVSLPMVSAVEVLVETKHVEQASTVVVRLTPRNGMVMDGQDVRAAIEQNAKVQEVVSTNPLIIRWVATAPALPGYSAVQARVIRP